MISPGDGIWSGAVGGNGLINLVEFIYLFIGISPIGIIKFFTAGLSPFLIDMGIRSFILFILNLYVASDINILIEADFA